MTLLSIITPTLARTKYLKKNLKEIDLLSKDFKSFEWVVVIENKDKITRKFFKQNNRKFIKKVIGNYNSAELAFENGVEKSRGKYIKFHGDDDFFDTNNIKSLNNQLFKKNYSWIIFDGAYVDENYKVTRRIISYIKHIFLKNYGFLDLSVVNYIMTPSVIIKKKIYKKLGGLGKIKRSGSDYIFWMKLSRKYKPFVILKRISFSMISKKTITGKFDLNKYLYLYKEMLIHNEKKIMMKILIFMSISATIIFNYIQKKFIGKLKRNKRIIS